MKSNLRKLMAVLLTVALLWTTVIPAFAEDVLVPEEDVIFAEPVDEVPDEVAEDLGNGLSIGDEDEQELTYEGQEAADEVAEEVVEQPIEADPVEAADSELDSNDKYVFYIKMKTSSTVADLKTNYDHKPSPNQTEDDPNKILGYEATYNGKTQKPDIELYAYNLSTHQSELVPDEGISAYTYSWYANNSVDVDLKDAPVQNANKQVGTGNYVENYYVGDFHWTNPETETDDDKKNATNSVYYKYPLMAMNRTEADDYDITGWKLKSATDFPRQITLDSDGVIDTADYQFTAKNIFKIEPVHLVVKITKDVNVSSLSGSTKPTYEQEDLPYEIENLPTDETERAKIVDSAFKAYAKIDEDKPVVGTYTLNKTAYTISAESATTLNNLSTDTTTPGAMYDTAAQQNYTFVDYNTEYPKEAADANTKKLTVVDYVITSHNDGDNKWTVEYDADGIDTTSAAAIIEAFGIKIMSGTTTDVTSNFQFTFKETEVKDVGEYHLTIASEQLACAPVEYVVNIVPQPVKVSLNAADLVVKYNGETQVPVYTAVDKDGNAVEMEIDAGEAGVKYTNDDNGLLKGYVSADVDAAAEVKTVREAKPKNGDTPAVDPLRHPQKLGAYTLTFKPVSKNYELAKTNPYLVTKKDATTATEVDGTEVKVPFVIIPREVIVSGLKTSSKVYNGQIEALPDVSAVKFLDAADGTTEITDETLKLSVKGSKAAFADANAGTGKTVYYALALDGTDLPYILVNNTQVKKIPADVADEIQNTFPVGTESAELAPTDDELKLYQPIYTTTDGVITPIQVKLNWKEEDQTYVRKYVKDDSLFKGPKAETYLATKPYNDPAGYDIDIEGFSKDDLKFGFAAQENGPALVKVNNVELPVNAGKYNLVVTIESDAEGATDKDKAAFAGNFEIVNPTHEIEVEPIYGFIGIELDKDEEGHFLPLYYDKNGAEPTFKVWFSELPTGTTLAQAQTEFNTFLTNKKTYATPGYDWSDLAPSQYEVEYVNNTGVDETNITDATNSLNAQASVAAKPEKDEKKPYILVTADPNNDPNNLCIAYKFFNIEKRPLVVNDIVAENKEYDGTAKATFIIDYDEGNICEGDEVTITAEGNFRNAANNADDANVVLKSRTSEPTEKPVNLTSLKLDEEANKLYRLYYYNKTTDKIAKLAAETDDFAADAAIKFPNIKAIINPKQLHVEWEGTEDLVYDGNAHVATPKFTGYPVVMDEEGNPTEEIVGTAEKLDNTKYTLTYTWNPEPDEVVAAANVKNAGDWTVVLELKDTVTNYWIDENETWTEYRIEKKPVIATLDWTQNGKPTTDILIGGGIYRDYPQVVYTGEELNPFTAAFTAAYTPVLGNNGGVEGALCAKLTFVDEKGREITSNVIDPTITAGATILASTEDETKDFSIWYDPDNINVGDVNFGVEEEPNGNYTFDGVSNRFEITSASAGTLRLEYWWDAEEYELNEEDYSQVVDQEYTGKPIELVPHVALYKAKDSTYVQNGKVIHYTDWEPVDLTESDFEFIYYNDEAEDEDTINVGHINVIVKPTENGNYDFAEQGYLGYNIVPKKVTPVVKVESPVTYDPEGQYVDYTVTDEDGNAISFLEYDITSGYEGTKVGKYNLVLTDVEGGNLELTFNKEGYAWEIVPAEAELVWANTELNYNGKAQKPTATVKGNANVTVTVTGEQTDAGKYTATASALSDANYKLPEKNTAEFSIAKLEVTVSNITAASKIEDGTKTATIDASNATFAGLLSGDELKIEKATGEFVTAAPGKDKTVTLKYELAGKSAKNYTLSSGSQKTATATITAKAIIEVDKDDRDYLIQGDTLPVAIYKDANGKLIGVAEVTLVEPAKLNGVGTYKAIAKLPANEKDYVADPVSFEFKVVPHEVSVSWVTDTFTYNGTAQGPVAFVDAETSAYTVTGDSATDAGSYTATVTLKDTKNYTFAKDAKTTQAYTIAQRPVTIAGITANDKVEDGTNTAEIITSGASFTGKLEKDTLTVTATGAFKDAAVGNGKEIPLTLTLGGKDAKNYTIADGSQKVTKANITAKPAQPSGTLILRTLSSGKDALKLKWKLMQNVDGYEIGYQKSTFSAKNAKKTYIDVVGNKTYRYTIKGLDEKTLYKVWIKAYVMKDGQKKYVATSPLTRSFTGYGTEKYTNAARLRVNITKAELTVNDTQKITATVIGKDTSKKLEPKSAALRYLSTDETVAKVSKTGTITGVKAGTCDIYVLTGNGLSKKVAVTVK